MNMQQIIREEARLRILEALSKEVAETLNSDMLARWLYTYGIRKPAAWVNEELRYLAEMGAISLVDVDGDLIATLSDKGRRHLDRDLAIEGIDRPERPGG